MPIVISGFLEPPPAFGNGDSKQKLTQLQTIGYSCGPGYYCGLILQDQLGLGCHCWVTALLYLLPTPYSVYSWFMASL